MATIQNLITLILVGFLITSGWADKSTFPPTPPSPTTPKDDIDSKKAEPLPTMIVAPFINPHQSDYYRNVDEFTRGDTRYLVVKSPKTYFDADHLCNVKYFGHLALIKDLILAKYIAIALSELSVLEEDTLWIGGVRDDDKSDWYWQIQENSTEPIAPEIRKLMEEVNQVQADDRNCLGFGRRGHEKPQFRPMTCRAIRGYICERPDRIIGPHNSTHADVIRLGSRKYKIFAEPVDYKTASDTCISMMNLADLAVIDNFPHAQQLGRYLLIGRPSLENAWIGARWNSKHRQYGFIKEDLLLSNTTDASGYPPWRHNKARKPYGCILLDRHIANITLFVEAPCGRKRAYICYKNVEDSIRYTDVIIGPDGYRLVFREMGWYDARDFCLNYRNYSGRLAEIDTKTQNYNLLYVMGENKTAVQHIWIGGQLNDTDNQWKWITNWTTIAVDKNDPNLILNWLRNLSYTEPVEEYYVCLNMDRNNHNFATHYGTNCDYEQPFVCHFSADNLTRLEADEKKANDW